MSVNSTSKSGSYDAAVFSGSKVGDGIRRCARDVGDIYDNTHFKASVARGVDKFYEQATVAGGWAVLGSSATSVGLATGIGAAGAVACCSHCCGNCVIL